MISFASYKYNVNKYFRNLATQEHIPAESTPSVLTNHSVLATDFWIQQTNSNKQTKGIFCLFLLSNVMSNWKYSQQHRHKLFYCVSAEVFILLLLFQNKTKTRYFSSLLLQIVHYFYYEGPPHTLAGSSCRCCSTRLPISSWLASRISLAVCLKLCEYFTKVTMN